MRQHWIVAGTVSLTCGLAIALAGPAAAAGPWEMPDIVGMDLESAQAEVAGLTDEVPLTLTAEHIGIPIAVLNETAWVVCAQSPEAGEPIDSEAQAVVARSEEQCESE